MVAMYLYCVTCSRRVSFDLMSHFISSCLLIRVSINFVLSTFIARRPTLSALIFVKCPATVSDDATEIVTFKIIIIIIIRIT